MRSSCWKPPSSDLLSSVVTSGDPGISVGSTINVSGHSLVVNNFKTSAALLIPAYHPGVVLVELVTSLARNDWAIVVIDDGSGPGYNHIFQSLAQIPNVTVVANAINLGKGSALKTGINFILCEHPEIEGVITVDADGQHHPEDVLKVFHQFLKKPEALVLGVRDFNGAVPWRSKVGNRITRSVLHALLGRKLTDSQTGLRAIPSTLLPTLLRVSAMGYEFELEMLVAATHLGVTLIEQPIRTIYEPGNPSSHFHPLRDSMRIYFVLLRFTFIGILTAALDNLVFFLLYQATPSIPLCLLTARIVAVTFNYTAIKKAVFLSGEPHSVVLPRHLLVVAVNGVLAYLCIEFLSKWFNMGPFPAKPIVETLLFIANFAIQRDFVFTKR